MDKERRVLGLKILEWLCIAMFSAGAAITAAALSSTDLALTALVLGIFCVVFPPMALGAEDAMKQMRRP
jgi:hypothetical protein